MGSNQQVKDVTGTVADAASDAARATLPALARKLTNFQHARPTGDIFFVGTGGSDSNTGTYESPFLTIDYAVGQCTANNNDVIIVLPGTYDEDANTDGVQVDVADITIIGPGNAENTDRVQVKNTDGAATSVFNITAQQVVIAGINVQGAGAEEGMVITGADAFILNCQFEGAMANGIRGGGAAIIERCYFHGITNDGIEITSSTCVVRDCHFYNIGDNAIHMNGGSENLIIRNTINGNNGTTDAGILIEAGDVDNLIAQNTVAGCTAAWTNNGGATNIFANNHIGSQITAGNSVEEDIGDTYDLVAAAITDLQDGSVKNVMVNRDMPYLTEFWETEALSATVWEETLDGAGTGVFDVADGYMYYDIDTENVLNSDAWLNTKYRWQSRPATFSDTNTSIEKLIAEWESRITGNLADIVNANFLMGFTETKGNLNTSNNIAAFTLDGSDNLISRTDNDGTDQDSGTLSATLTNWNKFRIEVYATGYKFYINETLVSTHETQVPDEAMYLVLGTRSDGVGAVGLDIGNVRIWHEEVV